MSGLPKADQRDLVRCIARNDQAWMRVRLHLDDAGAEVFTHEFSADTEELLRVMFTRAMLETAVALTETHEEKP